MQNSEEVNDTERQLIAKVPNAAVQIQSPEQTPMRIAPDSNCQSEEIVLRQNLHRKEDDLNDRGLQSDKISENPKAGVIIFMAR